MNLITRRGFFNQGFKTGLAVALSTLVDIPLVVKRALAEQHVGLNGKKLLFIFLRGANDGINSIIPIQDNAYNVANRPDILIPRDPGTVYTQTGRCDFPESGAAPAYAYGQAIRLGNGFAALHPSLKFLAPVYNAGQLSIIHRVGYPRQSRSHFTSQDFWETGIPNGTARDGIFYRTILELGIAQNPLTGISIQSALPLSLRGQQAAMTNLTNPTRYALLGIPNNAAGKAKALDALAQSLEHPVPEKKNREMLRLQYQNLQQTLPILGDIDFSENGNTFRDDANTDGDIEPYYLFPTNNAKNGGYAFHSNNSSKYVVDTAGRSYTFFRDLKAAALILNKTDAVIAGTEFTGFDTHNAQGAVTGTHANLQRRLAWAIYALRKYFTAYSDKVDWNNVIVVTLSEFGRTTVQNSNSGTDHAEAGVMFVAGGAVKGFQEQNGQVARSGLSGCHPNDPIPWVTGQTGSMFGISNRYLKRIVDYRSVLGEIIRDHLGASPEQLARIIPGYANESAERLRNGGTVAPPLDTVNTPIVGELDIV